MIEEEKRRLEARLGVKKNGGMGDRDEEALGINSDNLEVIWVWIREAESIQLIEIVPEAYKMVNRLASVLLLCTLSVFVSAKGVFGPCPSVSGVDNFNVGNYLGTWFEILRSTDMPFEKGDCSQAHYSVLPSGRVNVTNSEVRQGTLTYAYGQAYCDTDGYANCHVKFYWLSPYAGYQVLSTDYSQYAVVYSCFSIGVYHWSYGWLLSRTPTIDESYEGLLQVPDLTSGDFMHSNQVGCPSRNY